MSSVDPSVEWQHPGRPEHDPDGQLRAFFRAQMPEPWPAFRLPRDRSGMATVPERVVPSRTARHSRLALAATVVVLLVGTLLLSGKFHSSPAPETDYGTPSANRRAVPDMIMKESLIQEVETRPGPDGRPVRQNKPTKYVIEFFTP
jgi:hypothetical protein